VATAPVVIGADGLWSTVAEAVDAPVLATGRNASACWCTYVAGLPDEGYRWFYAPGAAAGYIPTNDGLTCVFAGGPADRFHVPPRDGRWDALLDAFTAAAPAAAEQLRAATPAEPVRGWPGVPSRRRRSHGPGWALVGDAGYFKDPISTHGMTDALRDAELVADALAGVASGTPERTALGGYHRRRDQLSHRLFRVSDEIAAYDWDGASVQPLLRRLSGAMTDEVEYLEARAAAGLVAS
jgi:flavin-dependent dehydrogenase